MLDGRSRVRRAAGTKAPIDLKEAGLMQFGALLQVCDEAIVRAHPRRGACHTRWMATSSTMQSLRVPSAIGCFVDRRLLHPERPTRVG
jgi:hypothetical protein